MNSKKEILTELNNILKSIEDISKIEEHHWVNSLFVKDTIKKHTHLQDKPKGYRILWSLTEIYLSITPSLPPQKGKRLDAKWGQFGILGALFFFPFRFGHSYPTSMRDAWGNIDESIEAFVKIQTPEINSKDYLLVSAENGIAPSSTLSDWKSTGLKRLAEAILQQEQLLEIELAQTSPLFLTETPDVQARDISARRKIFRSVLLGLGIIFLSMLAWLGWKGQKLLTMARNLRENLGAIQSIVTDDKTSLDYEALDFLVVDSYNKAYLIHDEIQVFVWLGNKLTGLPGIGYELSLLNDLDSIYLEAIELGNEAYLGTIPLAQSQNQPEEISEETIANTLLHYSNAHRHIENIQQIQIGIDRERLSPQGEKIFDELFTPHLSLLYIFDEGLYFGEAFLSPINSDAILIIQTRQIPESRSELIALYETFKPSIPFAQSHLDNIILLRGELNINLLLPQVKSIVQTYLDPHLPLAQLGLDTLNLGSIMVEPLLPLADFEGVSERLKSFDLEYALELLTALNIQPEQLEEITAYHEDILRQRQNISITTLHPKASVYLADYFDPHLPLLSIGIDLLHAAFEIDQGVTPILENIQRGNSSADEIIASLESSYPSFSSASEYMNHILETQRQLDFEKINNRIKRYLEPEGSLTLNTAAQGIFALETLPKLLGLGEFDPQTYLLIIQNEDELRATGGFITAVGTIVIDDGKPLSIKIVNSYDVDDPQGLYAYVPWQMQEYMQLGLWYMRDANWSPDFPIVARYAEELYAYYSGASVDGVIALDQESIRQFMTVLEPIEIEGETITADNVVDYLRASRAEKNLTWYEWSSQRKVFIEKIANAMIDKTLSSSDVEWSAMLKTFKDTLDQRHILFTLDDPQLTRLLAQQNWDGHIDKGQGDFLMLIESNLGYNKVNTVVESNFDYQVDLRNISSPIASLFLQFTNNAVGYPACVPGPFNERFNYEKMINQCYWNYLRVFTHEETTVTTAQVQEISAQWAYSGNAVPEQVDPLSSIDGGHGFGTFMVVPKESSADIGFDFQLSPSVLRIQPDGQYTYSLIIQKQSGQKSLLGSVSLLLPDGAIFTDYADGGIIEGNRITWVIDSLIDVSLWVAFNP